MFTGENLRLLRTIKGIPQKTLAKKMGVSQAAISKMERSKKIPDEKFELFLNAADCSMKDVEKIKAFIPPPQINKIRALALAFLISLIPSLMPKRFTPYLPICVFF